MWDFSVVKRRLTMRTLLAALAIFGLILTPVAAPAMAMAADDAAMTMSSDMPCCPDQAPLPDCAKNCPLMALCMAWSVAKLPAAIALFIPLGRASRLAAPHEAGLEGLALRPPPRPPKVELPPKV